MHQISEILCEVYNSLLEKGEVSFALREEQRKKIDSTVKTINAVYFGFARFETNKKLAVAYLCYIIKDHPVTDGNKRLAILWFQVFCDVFALKPSLSFSLDVLAVAIEQTKIPMDELMKSVMAATFPEELTEEENIKPAEGAYKSALKRRVTTPVQGTDTFRNIEEE